MQRDAPLVSVITPAYNAAATIAETIKSVQAQDFTDWEMVIVDDNSFDGTGAIVETFAAHDPRIRLIRRAEGGGGPARARNQGLRAASGRFIAFLDADDLFLPNKLSAQLDFMQGRDIAASYTDYRRFVTGEKPRRLIKGPRIVTFQTMLRMTPLGTLTVMIDRAKTGPFQFMEHLKSRDDMALWLSLTRKGFDFHRLDMDLSRYRIMKNSVSSKWGRSAWRTYKVYREVAGLTRMQAARSIASYGFFAAVKRVF